MTTSVATAYAAYAQAAVVADTLLQGLSTGVAGARMSDLVDARRIEDALVTELRALLDSQDAVELIEKGTYR